MNKPLSARSVETMKPGDKDRADIGENTGLRVSCGKGGAKTFYYRYKSPETGKLTQLKIGRFSDVSLSEARVVLAEYKAQRKLGLCPKAEVLREKATIKAAQERQQIELEVESFTVEHLVESYLTELIEDRWFSSDEEGGKRRLIPGSRKPKGQAETRRTLHGDAVRVLGHLPAVSITRKQVTDLINGIVARGVNVQAGSVLRELTAAYEYSIGLGRFPEDFANPALLAKAGFKQAKVRLTSKRGSRVLSDKELALVLNWLPGSGYSVTQKNVLHLTLWTGCRTGEVCSAEWRDIDLEDGTWHLRDSKNGAQRFVQLSKQAVSFLKGLRLSTDTYLFPSSRTKLPIQQKSLSETKWHLKNPDKVKGGQRYSPNQLWLNSIDDWSPHDLRRSVRTGLSRLGCPNEVAESILGHSRKGIEGTYDLHKYENECRAWLQRWADHLEGVVAT